MHAMKVFEASTVEWWLPASYIVVVAAVDVCLRGFNSHAAPSKKRSRNDRVLDDDSSEAIRTPLLQDSGELSGCFCITLPTLFVLSVESAY